MPIVRVTVRNETGNVGVFEKEFLSIDIFPGCTVIHMTMGEQQQISLIIDIRSLVIRYNVDVQTGKRVNSYYNATCDTIFGADLLFSIMKQGGWERIPD